MCSSDLEIEVDAGVTAIDFDFGRPTAAEVIAEMGRFKKAVVEKM